MARFVRGEVVVLPFPFSDLSDSKRRPALVLAALEGDDLVLCMITSQAVRDRYAISLEQADFTAGGLPASSNLRPSRLFTADSAIVQRSAGAISSGKLGEVIAAIVKLFDGADDAD